MLGKTLQQLTDFSIYKKPGLALEVTYFEFGTLSVQPVRQKMEYCILTMLVHPPIIWLMLQYMCNQVTWWRHPSEQDPHIP